MKKTKLYNLIRTHALPIVAFVFIFSLSLYAFFIAKKGAELRRERLFAARSSEAIGIVEERMNSYRQILRGTKAFLYASDSITKDDWRRYYEALKLYETYPGIQAVAFAAYVPKDELNTHLEQQRKEDSTYQIKPEGDRDFYTPIVFIEPFSGRNLRAYGYDMASEPIRREAMVKAAEFNRGVLSGKVKLVQETSENIQPGFLLYVPVFIGRQNENGNPVLKGFVYSPFRAYDVFDTILGDIRDIDLLVYDKELKPENLLYQKNRNLKHLPDNDQLIDTVEVELMHHKWIMVTTSSPQFGSVAEQKQPYLILGTGAILSLLLSFIIYILQKSRIKTAIELERTKELERQKDEFLGMASHELKTPLTSVKAYIQLLERHFEKNKADMTAASYIARTHNYIDKLHSLISDLLDSTKIQSGKLVFNITEFSIDELLKETTDSMQLIYKSHKLIKKGRTNAIVKSDRQRIEQVLLNLISNAVKYSPSAREVLIEIKEDAENVIISVTDYGVGIPQADIPHIFDRFYRVEKNSIKFTGLGLGLYISCEIMSRHRGKLWVESTEGKGSTFYMRLPIYNSPGS